MLYRELTSKLPTVKRFLPALLRVIRFEANPAAAPLLQALHWLRDRPAGGAPTTIVNKAWQRHVTGADGRIDVAAFTFCVLDKLRAAIRRRDVFVSPSWCYADPRAGLLCGPEWDATRPIICRSLGLSAQPGPTLALLAQELDETYRSVAAQLPHNEAVRFETIAGKLELVLSSLDKLQEPASLVALRQEIRSRMPRVDLPEILLEIAARTGCMEAFTHLTQRTARAADLTTSLCAVLLAEAFALAERGVTVDLTAFPPPSTAGGAASDEVSAADAVVRFLESGLPPERLTVSSDGGGCLPAFDRQGELLRMGFATSAALADLLADLLGRGFAPETVLPFFTSSPARLLRLRGKGRVAAGMDADLVILGPDGRPEGVMARGRWHVRDGRPVVRGLFETD